MSIRIGTNERGGTFFTEGETLAKVLREKTNLAPVKVCPVLSASVGGIKGLENNDFEFAISASNWIGRALRGEDPFEEPISLRMVAPANAGAMFFVVPKNSSLNTVDDLRGKRIAIGVRDGGMVQHIHTIFDALNIDFNEIKPLYETFPEGAKAMVAGEVDAQWRAPAPNQSMTDLANRMELRVLPYGLGRLETILSKVSFYRQTIIPAKAFEGDGLEAPQVGVLNVFVTHSGVPSNIVHTVTDTMVTNVDTLERMLPLYKGLRDLFDELRVGGRGVFEIDGVPLHSGASEAYRELGLIE